MKRIVTFTIATLALLAFMLAPAQAQDVYHLAWAHDTVYVVDTTGPAWPVGRAVAAMYDPSSQLRVIYTLRCPSASAQCVTVTEKALAWPVTGQAPYSYGYNRIFTARVELARWAVGQSYSYRLGIVAHELGHAVGLAHSKYTTSAMYPTSGFASHLGWRDFLYLRAAYGGNE